MNVRVKEWLKRYVPAELLSTAATIISGLLVLHLWHNHVAMAIAATWAGNIFYFGTILICDIVFANKQLKLADRRYTVASFLKNMRAFIVEFGIAEVLDSFVIRPMLLYYIPILIDSTFWGLLTGKILADITFYVPAIIGYEVAKKHFRDFK